MKKKIFVLLSIVYALFFVAACANQNSNVGKIVTLDYAYENELINEEQLLQISYIYNECYYDGVVDYGVGFVPNQNITNVDELDDEIVLKMKKSFLLNVSENNNDLVFEVDNVQINNKFYGIYDGCYAVNIHIGDPYYHDVYQLGNVVFYNYQDIMIWTEKVTLK